MKIVQTLEAPQAIGPYSQGVKVGNFVFTSGQIPLTADGKLVEGDIRAQTTQVLQNIKAVLAAEGLTPNHVIKTTIFLMDLNDFAAVNEVYGQFFGEHKSARTTVQVAGLPKNVGIEIECIATFAE